MARSGRFRPSNVTKYRGDYRNIIYRSSWEKVFMSYCDKNDNIIEWGSEEVIIPYRSPLDNRLHRYFPDFYVKVKDNSGVPKKYIIEINKVRSSFGLPDRVFSSQEEQEFERQYVEERSI